MMKRIQTQAGVTLMELVVTLALLGILAAIGTPMLLDNIRAAKNAEAQNTLRSIYLMQKNYFAENYCYFVNASDGDNTSAINQSLFASTAPDSGPIIVGGNNDFYFYILVGKVGSTGNCTGSLSNDYIAYAKSKTANGPSYSIDQQNVKTGF
jgi:prepilin-type N-terminal cleavage/methylation domain-containing protein